MWAVWVDGVEHRLDDRPLSDLEQLERDAGCPLGRLSPHGNAKHARALVRLLVGDVDVAMSDIRPSTSDLPVVWRNGWPDDGRTLDGWIVRFTKWPYSFTPRQIREDFTLRDLDLIAGSG